MERTEISVGFAGALVKAQGEIEGAIKGKKNPGFQNSKYADLASCWDACRESLQQNHIAVLQWPSEAPHGSIGLRTTLVYGDTGETLSEAFQMPLKDPSNPQAAGSAITYARRYALCSVIGICPEDDDGNAAARIQPAPKVKPQETTVDYKDLMVKASGDVAKMKTVYTDLKNSQVDEPGKTALLTQFGAAIKAAQKKDSL